MTCWAICCPYWAPASTTSCGYDSVEEVIAELEQLRDRINNGDSTARQQFKTRCLPTGAIDDIAISSGWTETWVKLVDDKYRSEFT